jgi:ABC-type glycerol-3-phosphate transport system substrate-binding protein
LRKLHLALLPALLLALALGLAACGGGGESDEDKITSTIEESATSTDPSICKETQTQAFMEQTSGGAGGKAAVKECEEETKSGEGNPDSVKVSEVEAESGKATADVAFKGGIFDGQTLEVALVEEDGDWKLNELTGFAKFDPEGLVNSFAEEIEEEPEIEPETASCFVEGIEELSSSELESVVIENNTEVFGEIAEGCE